MVREFAPDGFGHPIYGLTCPHIRALTVGFVKSISKDKKQFIPSRLHLGAPRMEDAFQATIETLRLTKAQSILSRYDPSEISTITLLRETLALNLPVALYHAGVHSHFGDCFIGANHVKTQGKITTAYTYENVEGLNPNGLWVLSDSIAAGRNLIATMTSLLSKFTPSEILMIVPIGNRWGINKLGEVLHSFGIKTTFFVWGALFGLNPENRYDEPWGLPDCEPVDDRDQKTFISMYSKNLCVGGDFGNDFYCPPLARKLYDEQIRSLSIIPKIPTVKKILDTYRKEEILFR